MANIIYKNHDIYEMCIKKVNDTNKSILVDNIKDISTTPSKAHLDSQSQMIILTTDVEIIDADGNNLPFNALKKGDILKGEFRPPIVMLMSYPGQIGAGSLDRLIKE